MWYLVPCGYISNIVKLDVAFLRDEMDSKNWFFVIILYWMLESLVDSAAGTC